MSQEQPEQIFITIRSLNTEGEGVGQREDGYTLFVQGALPGERVTVEIFDPHKRFARARLVCIDKPSIERVLPACPWFGECGGCQVMHASSALQLRYKRQKVVDALKRIGNIEEADQLVVDCIPSPLCLGYRNKIQLPVRGEEGSLKIGLFAAGSHKLVEIEKCLIHDMAGQEILHKATHLLQMSGLSGYSPETHQGDLRHILLKTGIKTREALLLLVSRIPKNPALEKLGETLLSADPRLQGIVLNYHPTASNTILGNDYSVLAGKSFFEEQLGTLRFRISSASFFQVNPLQAENLFNQVLHWTKALKPRLLIDAYCGVGTLALFLAEAAEKVIGFEPVQAAVQDAQENGLLNGIRNAIFYASRAEEQIDLLKTADLLLLNPPRKGCNPAVLQAALAGNPKNIIYISCNPSTLARDLALLQGYRLVEAKPFDLFPQTAHVETACLLMR